MFTNVILLFFFFFQAEDGIRDKLVTGVQTCALPIWSGEISGQVRPFTTLSSPTAILWRFVDGGGRERGVLGKRGELGGGRIIKKKKKKKKDGGGACKKKNTIE